MINFIKKTFLRVVREMVDQWINTLDQFFVQEYEFKNLNNHANYGGWLWRYCAHIVGFDNRWIMFGRQSRYNWWYVIKGVYGHGQDTQTVELLIPRRAGRNFWQQHFLDYKEGKFQSTIYSRSRAREAYARYLSRQFPNYQSQSIESVIFELHYQKILEPQEA